jgi:uncharacterized damage-inducible protein DinB
MAEHRADMFLDPADDPRESGPSLGDERATLVEFLRGQRLTLQVKCAGLGVEELARRSVEPSTMSLLGLVRHMADVERVWFRHRVAGEVSTPLYWSDAAPDGDFDEVADADAAGDFATYQAEVEAARAVMTGRGYDETFVSRHRDGTEEVIDLRALMLHMIEEYARHNGHADLLRECVDGTTGD